MSEEQDSWFKDAFGVDLGQSINKIRDEASAALGQATSAVSQVVSGVEGTVEGVVDGVASAAVGVVKKVAGAVAPSAGSGDAPAGGTGSFPLGGSVGRGGKNAPNDVRAVQAALGLGADGQCGEQTIATIEAFQRNLGQAKPDGRVDPGGSTERAMAGGGKDPATPAAPIRSPNADDGGIVGQLQKGAAGLIEGAQSLGDRVVDKLREKLDDSDAASDLSGGLGVLPEIPPRPAPNFDDDPNTVFAGEHFRMKMLEGLSFGEGLGLTTFTFVIWDVDNNRAAAYEYAAAIVTLGIPITFTGEGDFSDVFTTKAMQVDQFSCNASHGAVGAANLGAMVMNLDVATVSVPTGFSKGGGLEAGGGFFSLTGPVKVFKGE